MVRQKYDGHRFARHTERALNKRSVYYYLSELLTELSAIREVLQDEDHDEE